MKSLHILSAALVALLMASCSSKPTIDYMPAKAAGDTSWGMVDAEGNFLFTDEFENKPSPVVNGFFFVNENRGFTVYRAEKSPKIVGDLTDLRECGYYTEGLIPIVRKGEHITFVDDKGKTKFVLDKVACVDSPDSVDVVCCMSLFINGRCSFRTSEGKWGAIDKNGNVAVQPIYDHTPDFLEDRCLVRNADTGEFAIIDRDGSIRENVTGLPDNIKFYSTFFLDGWAIAKSFDDNGEDNRWYMVKKNGEVIKLPSSVIDLPYWTDGYIVYGDSNDNYGVMTFDGEVVVRPKYHFIQILANGQMAGVRNDKIYIINPDGEADCQGEGIFPAIREGYLFGKVFDFKFEMVKEDDDMYTLRSYAGEKIGKKMEDYSADLSIPYIYSDYFDYDAVTTSFMSLFDNMGLKDYPFGSQMSVYASRTGYSKEIFRGDRSMGVTINESNKYFHVPSTTIYSDNYIVHDVGGWDYYDWQYNPSATLNAFKLTLSLSDDEHTDQIVEELGRALENKYGVNIRIDGYGMNSIRRDGYCTIVLEVNTDGWYGAAVEAVAEETEVVCDSACVVEDWTVEAVDTVK